MDAHNQYIASLESRVDHLETELSYLNKVLIQCGFQQGISTLKATIQEMLQEEQFLEKPSS